MSEIFLGNDGNALLEGRPDYFSKFFDWQVTYKGILGNTDEPKTIYIKTDLLPMFVETILPKLKEEFILISGCSDYSPEINFKREYDQLLDHPLLSHWFMQNMNTFNEKTSSFPTGLGARIFYDDTPQSSVDSILMNVRNSVKVEEKIDKVFCSFRARDLNTCGDVNAIRPKIMKLIEGRTDIFDFYEPGMKFPEFIETLSKYKYALCPHGNGLDPSPQAWISLIVKTIPVVFKIPNTVSQFEGTDSVIFFEELEQLLDNNLYQTRPEANFDFLTHKYWADRINSKIKYKFIEGESHKHIITHFDSSEMCEIMRKRNLIHLDSGSTDKILAHSYTGIYEKWMKPIQNKEVSILEIGVYTGGSMVLWHDYFPNAKIYSVDVVDWRSELSRSLERVTFDLMDAYKEQTVDFLKNRIAGGFDIIIDDGPHTIESQIYIVKNYLKLLKPGGMLFVEDVAKVEWFDILTSSVPDDLKNDFEVINYDLREYKNRQDDLLILFKRK